MGGRGAGADHGRSAGRNVCMLNLRAFTDSYWTSHPKRSGGKMCLGLKGGEIGVLNCCLPTLTEPCVSTWALVDDNLGQTSLRSDEAAGDS